MAVDFNCSPGRGCSQDHGWIHLMCKARDL